MRREVDALGPTYSLRAGKRDAEKCENAHSSVVLDFSLLWHLITQVLVPHLYGYHSTH